MKPEIKTKEDNQSQPAVGHTEEQERFLNYVRTLSLIKTRLKGIDETDFVHIGQREIEERFFKWPTFSREKEIQKLIKDGSIDKKKRVSLTTGHMKDMYRSLRLGALDASLVPVQHSVYGSTQTYMLECLKNTSIEPGTETTQYFEFFQANKANYPDLFFKFDNFSHRCHTPVTSLPGSTRDKLLLYNMPVISFDVSQMQPQILGTILRRQLGQNQFSTWMDTGSDVYRMIAAIYNFQTRAEGKKRFFEILFGVPNDQLTATFGETDWINWINNFKRKRLTANPHFSKRHTNLAWLLQTTEVAIMKAVWIDLAKAEIPFLTVHDEIICRRSDKDAAFTIISEILKRHFTHFQLNVS